MALTRIPGQQLKDGSIGLQDLEASLSGDITQLKTDVTGLLSSVGGLAVVATTGSYNDLLNRPTLFSGSYNDLTNRPTLSTVATSGSYLDLTNRPTLFSGSYSDLTDRPSFALVATSGSYLDLSNRPTLFSGSYNDLSDKPTLFSGNYNDLTNKPTLFSGSYNDLSDKPTLAAVATSGSYLDLTNTPTIPSITGLATESYVNNKVADLVNSAPAVLDTLGELATALGSDPNFATTVAGQIGDLDERIDTLESATVALNDLTDVTITTPSNGQVLQYNGTAWINGAAPSTFSGSYNDLTDKPVLADVATSGSYLDLSNKPTLFSGDYNDLSNKPTLFSGSYNDLSDKPTLFSGSYNDLSDKPTLATVATSGSYNDLLNLPTLFSGAYADLTGKPNLAAVATSGSYADLSNTPTIPSTLDDLTNVVITTPSNGQVLKYNGTSWANAADSSFSGDYEDLTNKPNLADVATSGSYLDLTNAPTLALVATSGSYLDLSNRPTLFGGSYNDLSDKPTLATVATSGSYSDLLNLPSLFSGAYADLSGKPNLATVATSGSYNDLSDTPTIPSITGLATETYVNDKVADLVNSAPAVLDTLGELATALGNDENFATTVAGQIGDLDGRIDALESATVALNDLTDVTITTPSNGQVLQYNGTAWINGAAPSTFSGSYNDLTDKPVLADVATSGSYLDLSNKPTLFSGSYNDLSDKPSLFSGDYSDLTNKPVLALVATSGDYLDLSNRPSLSTVATSGSYNDLLNLPTLFSGDYNDLSNKPTLFSGSYNDLSDKPTLATVATSGSYNDLLNLPTLFSGDYADLSGKPTLAAVATSGSYNDLSDTPTIPSITGLATESYVDGKVADLVNSAPAVLDTLGELATALGNDENFATTIAGQIGDLDDRIDDLESSAAITREVPTGSINGTNTVFTLANTPIAGSEQVFVNGVLQEIGADNDYTISGSTITFVDAPLSGWKIHVTYITGNYTVAPGGSSSGTGSIEIFQDAEFTWTASDTRVDRVISHNKNRKPDLIKIFTKVNDVWVEELNYYVFNGNRGWYDVTDTSNDPANNVVIGLFQHTASYAAIYSVSCRIRLYWFGTQDVGTASAGEYTISGGGGSGVSVYTTPEFEHPEQPNYSTFVEYTITHNQGKFPNMIQLWVQQAGGGEWFDPFNVGGGGSYMRVINQNSVKLYLTRFGSGESTHFISPKLFFFE